ncbi:hypothetical protein B296_00017669 [Ensete ventricosum]|uniref:Uncharacterized protein n=1 Tax=Ensete ventricosum TaxID=4639 RepID=A0A426ZDR0_ENSVE|nr:hypothetical protein B296_00017669 [Ensete ventricosum]
MHPPSPHSFKDLGGSQGVAEDVGEGGRGDDARGEALDGAAFPLREEAAGEDTPSPTQDIHVRPILTLSLPKPPLCFMQVEPRYHRRWRLRNRYSIKIRPRIPT